MKEAILENIEKNLLGKKHPSFAVGDKLSVFVRLKEGDKERLQAFKGVVISKTPKSGKGAGATFTVRKISEGVGVERVFPINSPAIDRIQVESSSDVRRSRLYYLRALQGKKARLKESERFGEVLATAAPAVTESDIITTEVADQAPAPEKKKKEKSDKK
jgi:large subunit ribosomal protein L19